MFNFKKYFLITLVCSSFIIPSASASLPKGKSFPWHIPLGTLTCLSAAVMLWSVRSFYNDSQVATKYYKDNKLAIKAGENSLSGTALVLSENKKNWKKRGFSLDNAIVACMVTIASATGFYLSLKNPGKK